MMPISTEPMTGDEIRQALREHQPILAERFGVRSLALFGSVARGEATAESDVDLLVEFDRPVGLFELFALQDELELILGRRVDVGTVQSLKPRVRERVLEEMVHVLQGMAGSHPGYSGRDSRDSVLHPRDESG